MSSKRRISKETKRFSLDNGRTQLWGEKLRRNALRSRLILIGIQAIANLVLTDHDAGVFLYPKPERESKNVDVVIEYLFGGLKSWDSQYFMHISINGYTYENTIAFFPLLPKLVSLLRRSVIFLLYYMSEDSLTIILFTVINILFFLLAVDKLYELSLQNYDRSFAYESTMLFIYNPASIFFSAAYTESLFAYLTFSSIFWSSRIRFYRMTLNYEVLCKAMFFISLSTLTRTNGILNIGFLAYFYLVSLQNDYTNFQFSLVLIRRFIIILVVACLICLVPFLLTQVYFYYNFCKDFTVEFPAHIREYATANELVLPGQHSNYNQTWCAKYIPLSYNYIQAHYWNVGFFNYYSFKQIPNFLLAFPILYLVLQRSYKFFRMHWNKLSSIKKIKTVLLRDNLVRFELVTTVHLFVLSIFCILYVHIQVSTRMLCAASPAVYWYGITVFNKRLVQYYCAIYYFIGTVLFANFYPWT